MPVIIVPGSAYGASTGDQNCMKYWAKDLKAQGIVAIAIRARGKQLQDRNSPYVWHLLKGIECVGTGLRETTMQATATDPPPTSQDYYLSKIQARISGRTRSLVQDIGQGSEGQARTHARRLLQAVADNGTGRDYEIVSQLPAALPQLGDTVTVGTGADAYTGVVDALTWNAQGEAETLTLHVVDYTATVLQ